ncbi:MAG: hypothetical protein PHI94_02230 [Eubacteriaceae bacterium]|jgi:hypothetical protein|nr:hypothetical protein [Eubacteriaceae bacterium]MDD4508006.1 hypothetical protein [Eubacteriaceae bacterium]
MKHSVMNVNANYYFMSWHYYAGYFACAETESFRMLQTYPAE